MIVMTSYLQQSQFKPCENDSDIANFYVILTLLFCWLTLNH